MKVTSRRPGRPTTPRETAEDIILIQETLDSEGWAKIERVIVEEVLKARKRIFDMSTGNDLLVELLALKRSKAVIEAIYKRAALDVPPHLSTLFQ